MQKHWGILTSVTDTTNGFKTTGTIEFINPSDRGTCNKELDGTPFSSVTNYTYIALQRTINNIVTAPIVDNVAVAGATDSMIFQEDLLKLNKVSSPPQTCNAIWEGSIYYDSDINKLCNCDATNWVQVSDYSTVCS